MNTQNISISAKEKMILVSNFATMLSAGISILEVIDSLLEDGKGNQKKILQALREDLVQGKRVYASFAKFPKVFDKVTVNIIKASEEAGTLDVALKDLKTNIKKDMEFSNSIKAALMYPLIIGFVFIAVLLLILVVVIPKISVVFSRLKMELPLPTKILLWLSDLLIHNTIPLILGLATLIFAVIFFYKTQKQVLLNILYSFPIISNLIKQIDLARFARSLYLLLNAGIPITTALEFSAEVIKKKEVYLIISNAQKNVLSGKRLSEGLKEGKKVIPYIMIKIVEAGEKTGSLDKSMEEISEYLDYEVATSLKTVTSLMEPIMLVAVGFMVGGMMLSIIAPIYGLIGQVGGR